MGRLNSKYYDNNYVPNGFGDIIDKAVKNKTLPENTYDILNSFVKRKDVYKGDLEDVLNRSEFQKGKDDTTSVKGILAMIIRLGESIQKLHKTQGNLMYIGLSSIYEAFYTDYNHSNDEDVIPYNGALPSINDTKALKNVKIRKGNYSMRLNDNIFSGILTLSEVNNKYYNAILKGDTSLNDNFNTPMGFLYVFYKTIKRRSDAVNTALDTVKSTGFKGDKTNLYHIKKISSIENESLQDRKTWLNITAEIRQIIRGSRVTIPDMDIDKKNFLYYKRNTFDLFIDESRRMSFQFIAYNNPDRMEVGETYAVDCRVGNKVYKGCEMEIFDLGVREKQESSSAFPIVDAYKEFINIFNQYKEIRDAYLATN